jgi:hypothetical protein
MMKPKPDSQNPSVRIQSGTWQRIQCKRQITKKFGFTVNYVMAAAKAYMDRAQSQMAASGL